MNQQQEPQHQSGYYPYEEPQLPFLPPVQSSRVQPAPPFQLAEVTNWYAVSGLLCAICSVLWLLFGLMPFFALVLSLVGLLRSEKGETGRKIAIIGIIISILFFVPIFFSIFP